MAKDRTIYRVVCDVPGASLTTVLGVIEGAAKLVEVRPTGEVAAAGKTNGRCYAGGKRNKGISGRDLVLKVVNKYRRAVSREEMSGEFAAAGFAPMSWSAAVTALERAKKVRRLDNGSVGPWTAKKQHQQQW